MAAPKYSVIVPVYNRPDEVRDLLTSLASQTRKEFEVIIVEDGSTVPCADVVEEFARQLQVHYYYKANSGPGPARNFGFAHAQGTYFVVFDSDCMLPAHYFEAVEQALVVEGLDAWGGPDRAHENFTVPQRAMAYTMSSFLTTGGIRGGKRHVGWFQPRSFNMGISRKVFEVTGGFHFNRFAEDIEFSIRMKKVGFRTGLIPDAWVYHKRRATFLQFFRQVFNFGKGRAMIGVVHPEEVKLAHWFPAVFTVCTVALPLLGIAGGGIFSVALGLFVLYLSAIFVHAFTSSRHGGVAALSVVSALLQLWGYGMGFVWEKVQGRGSPQPKSPQPESLS